MATTQELIDMIEQAAEQMIQAANTIESLREQLERAQNQYEVATAERDHWYAVAIGANRA